MKKQGLIFAAVMFVLILFFLNVSLLSQDQMNEKSLVVQTFKNQEVRCYHVMKRIDEKLSEQLKVSLLNVDGVSEVRAGKDSDKYEIKIRKGLVFNWEKIEPDILRCITIHCYEGRTPAIRRVEAKY